MLLKTSLVFVANYDPKEINDTVTYGDGLLFRPEDRVNRLAEQLANSEGKIGENVSRSLLCVLYNLQLVSLVSIGNQS